MIFARFVSVIPASSTTTSSISFCSSICTSSSLACFGLMASSVRRASSRPPASAFFSKRGHVALEALLQLLQPLLFLGQLVLFRLHLPTLLRSDCSRSSRFRVFTARASSNWLYDACSVEVSSPPPGLLAEGRQIDALGDGQHLNEFGAVDCQARLKCRQRGSTPQ